MPAPDSPSPPRYLTTEQAATSLGVTAVTIRGLLGSEIHAIKVGRVLRIDAASLEAYRARAAVRPKP